MIEDSKDGYPELEEKKNFIFKVLSQEEEKFNKTIDQGLSILSNLEASMKLLSEDETKVTPCDVSVSGTYLNIHGEDYMVLTVYDVTELKNAQRLLTIEREHSISADKLKSAGHTTFLTDWPGHGGRF